MLHQPSSWLSETRDTQSCLFWAGSKKSTKSFSKALMAKFVFWSKKMMNNKTQNKNEKNFHKSETKSLFTMKKRLKPFHCKWMIGSRTLPTNQPSNQPRKTGFVVPQLRLGFALNMDCLSVWLSITFSFSASRSLDTSESVSGPHFCNSGGYKVWQMWKKSF